MHTLGSQHAASICYRKGLSMYGLLTQLPSRVIHVPKSCAHCRNWFVEGSLAATVCTSAGREARDALLRITGTEPHADRTSLSGMPSENATGEHWTNSYDERKRWRRVMVNGQTRLSPPRVGFCRRRCFFQNKLSLAMPPSNFRNGQDKFELSN